MKNIYLGFGFAAAAAVLPLAASAATVAFFTDRGSFEAAAAAGGLATATGTFDTFSDTPETTQGALPDFAVGPIAFSGVDVGLTTRNIGDPQARAGITGTSVVYSGVKDGALTNVFGNVFFRASSVSGPLFGFGFDLSSSVSDAFFLLSGSFGLEQADSMNFEGFDFVGFLSSEAATSYLQFDAGFSSREAVASYDNLTVAFVPETTPVPLPATLPLALAAFAGLIGLGRARTRRAG